MTHAVLATPRPEEARASMAPPPSQLRFITCGSVDDGKSTLIGRLLAETGNVPEDQLSALAADSRQHGTQGGEIDYALLLDGLSAEREQGITIDVAHRYFATARRRFIVADTPGHRQYTRNMATGASTSELAVLLIDARKGVLDQTRRHCLIVALLGVRHIVVAVNKMDLVEFSRARFDEIVAAFHAFSAPLGLTVVAIPLAARTGDNVARASAAMPWHEGPTLLEHLETVQVDGAVDGAFRMPVQWVNRPSSEFRGFSGTVARGIVRPGDTLRACPGEETAKVARVVTQDGDLAAAGPGQAITLVLDEEIDISRGDVLAPPDAAPDQARTLSASLLWVAEVPLVADHQYWLKIGATLVPARVRPPRVGVDIDTGGTRVIDALGPNEIGRVTIDLDRPVAADRYAECRETGGFILIDRISNATLAVGMVEAAGERKSRKYELEWRSLAKAFTWRAAGTVETMLLALLFTGHVGLAAAIGGIEVLTKTVLYYGHERVWARLRFGLRPGETPR